MGADRSRYLGFQLSRTNATRVWAAWTVSLAWRGSMAPPPGPWPWADPRRVLSPPTPWTIEVRPPRICRNSVSTYLEGSSFRWAWTAFQSGWMDWSAGIASPSSAMYVLQVDSTIAQAAVTAVAGSASTFSRARWNSFAI